MFRGPPAEGAFTGSQQENLTPADSFVAATVRFAATCALPEGIVQYTVTWPLPFETPVTGGRVPMDLLSRPTHIRPGTVSPWLSPGQGPATGARPCR